MAIIRKINALKISYLHFTKMAIPRKKSGIAIDYSQ